MGPRISIEELLSSFVESSNSAISASIQFGKLPASHGGSLAGSLAGTLAALHGGSLAGLHGGSLAGLHGGSFGRPQAPSKPQTNSFGATKTPVRLPTPAEGCGISSVQKSRIVGGKPAKNGAWPWMALLGSELFSTHFIVYTFTTTDNLL